MEMGGLLDLIRLPRRDRVAVQRCHHVLRRRHHYPRPFDPQRRELHIRALARDNAGYSDRRLFCRLQHLAGQETSTGGDYNLNFLYYWFLCHNYPAVGAVVSPKCPRRLYPIHQRRRLEHYRHRIHGRPIGDSCVLRRL